MHFIICCSLFKEDKAPNIISPLIHSATLTRGVLKVIKPVDLVSKQPVIQLANSLMSCVH